MESVMSEQITYIMIPNIIEAELNLLPCSAMHLAIAYPHPSPAYPKLPQLSIRSFEIELALLVLALLHY